MGRRVPTPARVADAFAAVMGARRGALHSQTAPDPRDAHPHAHLYGPQGDAVARLIDQVRTLTDDQCARLGDAWGLSAAWATAPPGAEPFCAADGAAQDAALDARASAWGAARDALGAAWNKRHTERVKLAGSATVAEASGAAEAVSWGAAHALLVRDLLTAEHYQVLTHPWREAVGPLPE